MRDPEVSGDMSPDTWSQPEIIRALQRIEKGVADVASAQQAQRSEFVPREVWDEAWRGLSEWKAMVSTDTVNLDASLTRHSRDHSAEHEAIRAHIDQRIEAEREERVSGQRVAMTIGGSALVMFIGTLITMVMNGGA